MRPSRNEAAIYQQMHGHRDIVVELSGWSPLGPINARRLDARGFASLAAAPAWARFEPDSLATPDGMLRLSETALCIDSLLTRTRDDRAMSASVNAVFAIKRDAATIARQVGSGIFKILPQELPARLAAAVRAEVSRLRYDELQAKFSEVEQSILVRLRAAIGHAPASGKAHLGVLLSSLTIDLCEDHSSRADTPFNPASFIAQTAGAIEAMQGTATMNEIAPLVVGQYSFEQTKALARAPNGFMIAPQHLGGFDPHAGAYSPMINPALTQLRRARADGDDVNDHPSRAPVAAAPVASTRADPTTRARSRRRIWGFGLRPKSAVGGEFDFGRHPYGGPL